MRRALRYAGTSARTRSGLPEPLTIFNGGAMTTAPGRRQLVQIGQARQAETVGPVHDGVAGKHRIETVRLSGIRSHRLDTHPENIPLLCQERHALRIEARECASRQGSR
jgi:hypothetical protein